MVSNVHIVVRTVKVGKESVRLGGIGNIATKVEWRQRGYASRTLEVAQDFFAPAPAGGFWIEDFHTGDGLTLCQSRLEQGGEFIDNRSAGWKGQIELSGHGAPGRQIGLA
ncbi:MAG: hypothetical protein ABSA01_03960 [Anaerolineales bacterium]|jgi:hypothetical protein